jgi:hypothetical protein
MLHGFNFLIPGMLITGLTIILGGPLSIIAWVKVLIEPASVEPTIALRPFTVAVFLDVVAIPVLWAMPNNLGNAVWLVFMIASFIFVLSAWGLCAETPDQEKGL